MPPPGPPPRPPMPPPPETARPSAGAAKAAALRESARHEPALFTAHAGNAAGLTIGAESAHPAGMPRGPRPPGPSPPIIMKSIGLTWPAAPDAVSESPDVPTENPGGRLSCAATASSESSATLTPACCPVCCPCPARVPGWPGAPDGVPTVPRKGAGAWRRSAGACRRCGRRCGRFRGFHARGERQRDVLLRPAGRLHHHVQRHGREAREVRHDRVGAGTGNRDRIRAVLACRRRYRRAAGFRRHRETDARQAGLASRGGAADDARRRLALARRVGEHPRR